MAKEKLPKHSMFINKDGYPKGGVVIPNAEQNLEMDPRGKSSFRAKGSYIATGDTVDVQGQGSVLNEKKKKAKFI